VSDVGMSSSLVGRHLRTAWGGRRCSSTSLQISLSLMVEGLNISRCHAAMAAGDKRLCGSSARKKKARRKSGEDSGDSVD
jgi:hypothetical protein